MGYYLNPGNDGFAEALRSAIYIDKTGLIAHTNQFLNTKEKYVCVSRPRRFGKSMALEMLAAYYSCGCSSGKLFAGKEIEKDKTYPVHLNQYDVIYLNMQQFLIEAAPEKITEYMEQEVLEEIYEEYSAFFKKPATGLAGALRKLFTKAGKKFIFLIDEWDCVVRERQVANDLLKQYLDYLQNLLKDQPYVALAYMTGILPVKKYGQHSALNMFWEYSMIDQNIFEKYTGFTESEVKQLCKQFHMDFTLTSSWYDGYRLRHFPHVYNPRSVVAAMKCRNFSNYWTATETYEALKLYIDMDFDGLRSDLIQMLGGNQAKVNTCSFQNDMRTFKTKDDVLTLLIHLGYLGYDAEAKEAFIPNREISGEFENAMSTGGWPEVMRILKASEKLLADTLLCREKSVAEGLDRAHMEISSILTYNDENSLSCAIRLAYYSAVKDYRIIRELPSGHGFADLVFLPLPHSGKPALIVELKYSQSAETAIQQIKNRRYPHVLEGYTGELLLIGINYDRKKKDKPHSCVIEKHRCSV